MSKIKPPSQNLIRERFMQAMNMVPNPERLASLQQHGTMDEAFLMTMSDIFGAAFDSSDIKHHPLAIMGRKLMGPRSLGPAFRTVGAHMAVRTVCAPSTVTERDRRDIYEKFESAERFDHFFQGMLQSNLLKVQALRA